MEWQQIVGFYHTARLGSFTKAAEVTFRSQSALSQQVKALEEELACQLLERIGKRKLRLTEAGERFLRFSEALLENYDRLQEELHEIKGRPQGYLRIAAPFTTLYHLFRDIWRDYVSRFPQVKLSILDRSQQSVIDLVKAGEIDFGLALESVVPKNLVARRWHKVEMVLMTPRGHPLAQARRVTLKEIAQYPLILPPAGLKYPGRRTLEEALRKLGASYHIIMESSNVELSSLYVELGLGLSFATIFPDLAFLEKRRLAFVSLGHYFKPDFIAVVMRQDKLLAPYKRAFLEMLLGHKVA